MGQIVPDAIEDYLATLNRLGDPLLDVVPFVGGRRNLDDQIGAERQIAATVPVRRQPIGCDEGDVRSPHDVRVPLNLDTSVRKDDTQVSSSNERAQMVASLDDDLSVADVRIGNFSQGSIIGTISNATFAATPEPSSIVLLSTLLGGVLILFRKRLSRC